MDRILKNTKARFDEINAQRDEALDRLEEENGPSAGHKLGYKDLKHDSQWLEGQKAYVQKVKAIHSKAERARAKIIADLLQLNPRYLKVDWVADEIISWMDRPEPECKDYLKDAFVATGKRKKLTEEKVKLAWRDAKLAMLIDGIVKKEGVSKEVAYRKVAFMQDSDENPDSDLPMWNENNEDHDLARIIKKAYLRHKTKMKRLEEIAKS